jgi:hypothetical protein
VEDFMKSFFFSIICLVLCLPQIASSQETKREITNFLQSNYGIFFEPSFFQKYSWNCPEKRLVKPSGNVTYNWVCERKDASLKRVIIWRADDKGKVTLEQETFISMAGGKNKKRGEPQCKESSHTVDNGKIEGVIRDCMLPLPNGEFYVSFFHFKHRDLAFTFVVKNASPTGSTPEVAEDLRKWIAELKFIE